MFSFANQRNKDTALNNSLLNNSSDHRKNQSTFTSIRQKYTSALSVFALVVSSFSLISCAQNGGDGDADTYYIEHEGLTRAYRLYTPTSYNPATATPLVVNLHGYALDSQQNVGNPHLEELADQENFIIAYPKAIGGIDLDPNTNPGLLVAGGFNAGPACCPPGSLRNVDDVGFVRKAVEEVSAMRNIDAKRIYATGVSAGSSMSYRLAVDASDIFAAILGISGPYLNGIDSLTMENPVTTISFDGVNDILIPYDGGIGWAVGAGIGAAPSRAENFAAFAEANNCQGSPVETFAVPDKEVSCMTYQNCDEHAEVTQCIFGLNNHFISTPLDMVTRDLSNEMVWTLLSEHAKL